MITELSVLEPFKAVQLRKVFIGDTKHEVLVTMSVYKGDSARNRSDYYTCMWGTDIPIDRLVEPLLKKTIEIHEFFCEKSEFPKKKLLFDLYWRDKEHQNTDLNEIMDTTISEISQQISDLVNNHFVRLDGQFFSITLDNLRMRRIPTGLSADSISAIRIASMFNLSSYLIDLYKATQSITLPQGLRPDFPSLFKDIDQVVGIFRPWNQIRTTGGQLEQLTP